MGLDYEIFEEHIQGLRGPTVSGHRPPIRGVSYGEMTKCLSHFGAHFEFQSWEPGDWAKEPKPTFAAWLRNRTPEVRCRTCIVATTTHYLAVRGMDVWDNQKGAATEANCGYRRARISVAWILADI